MPRFTLKNFELHDSLAVSDSMETFHPAHWNDRVALDNGRE